jgi:hypothetical protein
VRSGTTLKASVSIRIDGETVSTVVVGINVVDVYPAGTRRWWRDDLRKTTSIYPTRAFGRGDESRETR